MYKQLNNFNSRRINKAGNSGEGPQTGLIHFHGPMDDDKQVWGDSFLAGVIV